MKTIINWFIEKTCRKLRVQTADDGSLQFVYGWRGESFDSWLAKRNGAAK